MPRSAYDVTLTVEEEAVELHLMAYRPESKTGSRTAPPLSIAPQPLREGDQFFRQEQRALYNDGSGGAGHGEWPQGFPRRYYHYALPGDATQPGLFMPPGLVTEMDMTNVNMVGPVYAFIDAFAGGGLQTYAVGNRYLVGMPLGVGTPAIAKDLGAGFTGQSMVNWYGNVIIGGSGGPIWKFDTTTLAVTQSADVWRQYLDTTYWVRGGQGLPRLVGSTAPSAPGYLWPDRSIEYTDNADPMTEAVWSEEIFVGNTGHSITGVISTGQRMYYVKSNGLYEMDERLYSPNVTAYRANVTDVENPMPVWLSNGHIYFGSRTGVDRVALAEQGIRQDRPQRCEFGYGLPNYGPIRGLPTAGLNLNGYSAVAYWNEETQTTYLCYGIDYRDVGQTAPPGAGPLLWHGAMAVLPGVQVLALHLSTPSGAGYAPRLLIGGWRPSTTLATIHWLSLPQAGSPYQDLLQGGPMRFANEMTFVFPRETYGNDVARKDLTQISIRGDDLGASTLAAYVASDGGDFGAVLGQASTAYEPFSVDDPTNVRDLVFKVVGQGTDTVPPVLRALEAQAGVSVEANDIHTYVCEAGLGVKLANGTTEDRQDLFALETALRAIRGKRGVLKDWRRNREYQGRVLQDAGLVWAEYPSGQRTGRVIATIPFLARPSGWSLDAGHSWDTGLRVS